ncbi:MAG: 4'-phosphopantetheinyl transferase superfamily protein [Anaerolineaceae bacterium]|jgi:4'-phosphopantetheinyl transferase
MIFWTLARPAWDEANPPDDFLSGEEKKRLSELRFQKRRTDWLRGRWAAKKLLLMADPGCSNLPIQTVQVANETEGAPYLLIGGNQRYPGVLSISHCGPYALCALSDSKVGCDLEHIELRPDIFIEDFFTRAEVQYVRESTEVLRSILVNLIWSMKEAVLKSIGKGLHMDTRMVQVDPRQNLTIRQVKKSRWMPVTVHSPAIVQPINAWWQLRDDYVLTLAAIPGAQQRTAPKIKEIDLPPE